LVSVFVVEEPESDFDAPESLPDELLAESLLDELFDA